MEFYLLEDLEFNLTVFHPYQDLADLCTTQDGDDSSNTREFSGRGKLVLEEGAMQTAWYVFVIPSSIPLLMRECYRFIISDSMRTELCLLHPPYIIAVAALYMTCVLHNSISTKLHPPNASSILPSGSSSAAQSPVPRDPDVQSGANTPSSATASPRDDILNFLAGLNVSIEIVATVCQQIMSMYDLWDSFTDHSDMDVNRRVERRENQRQFYSYRGSSPPPEKKLVTEKEIVEVVVRMRTDR